MDNKNSVKLLLGRRIREFRKHNKYTQEQLAERIGIEVPSLSNIENGKNYPNAETIEKIAKGLNIQVFELYIFQHLKEPDANKMMEELNIVLKKDTKLLRTIYQITNNLKKL